MAFLVAPSIHDRPAGLSYFSIRDVHRDDRTVMAQIYGAGGVPAYWIVNLVERQVEVHQGPSAEGHKHRAVYPQVASVPVAIDGNEVRRIAVDDILPKPRGE